MGGGGGGTKWLNKFRQERELIDHVTSGSLVAWFLLYVNYLRVCCPCYLVGYPCTRKSGPKTVSTRRFNKNVVLIKFTYY